MFLRVTIFNAFAHVITLIQANMILKRIQSSIDTYFPSVKIMIGEFDYGNDEDISHGLSIADFLGTVSQHGVEIATRWDLSNNAATYTKTAYQLFRNYDGVNGAYGSQAVASNFNDRKDGSVWASINDIGDQLHLIILNKDVTKTLNFSINTNESGYQYEFKNLYAFNGTNSNIFALNRDTVSLSGSSITGNMEPLTAYHLVLSRTSTITNIYSKPISEGLLYPNPTSGAIFLNDSYLFKKYEVYNIHGSIKTEGVYSSNGIDLSDLIKGLYLIKVEGQVLKAIKD